MMRRVADHNLDVLLVRNRDRAMRLIAAVSHRLELSAWVERVAFDPRQRIAHRVAIGQRLRKYGRQFQVVAHAYENYALSLLRNAEPLSIEQLRGNIVTDGAHRL